MARITTADFDNDGDLDLIKTLTTHFIVFEENLGAGLFAQNDTLQPGTVLAADTADFNNDGLLDYTYCATQGIFNLINQGNNNFLADTLTTLINDPYFIKTADIDNDGDMDIAISTRSDRLVIWEENINSGESWVQHTIAMVNSNSDGLEIIDINGDGLKDVITIEYNGPVNWHENLGNGTFSTGTNIGTVNKPADVKAADVDNDNDLDILVGSYNEHKILLFENSGNSTFKSPVALTSSAQWFRRMTCEDIDLDGDIDILGISEADDQFFILQNLGNGVFAPEKVIDSHDFPSHITIGDMDNDNDKDVFVGYWFGDVTYFYKNLTKGGIKVSGKVLFDEQAACNGTIPAKNILVKAGPGSYTALTNESGEYTLYLDTGTFNISPVFSQLAVPLITDSCEAFKTVSSNTGTTLTGHDFSYQVKNCSSLDLQLNSTRRRRCFTSLTTVSYTNHGFADASGLQLKVYFPEYVKPLESSVTPSVFTDSLLVFDLENIAPGVINTIIIKDSVICGIEDIRGLTQCTKAVVTESPCDAPSSSWDKSSIVVSGKCYSNMNIAEFRIKNGGDGNMIQQSEFRIYYNDTLVSQEMFQLNSGKELVLNIPAYGQTIRVEADQHPEHPGHSRPRETIEACGSSLENAFRGYILSVPQDDMDEHVEIECLEIIDSYDPNDKLSSPQTYIENSEFLEYTIRFQNTGSDTAFKVVVVDTLSAALDINTLEFLSTSHQADIKIDTRKGQPVLTWSFQDIDLPDSTTNEEKSHGYIKFRIKPHNLPDGTEITNKAHIYFDYNSPIITNNVLVTMGFPEITDFTKGPDVVITYMRPGNYDESVSLLVTPNPLAGQGEITGLPANSHGVFTVYSSQGKIIATSAFSKSKIRINAGNLKPGIYFYKISVTQGDSYSGSFMVRE